MSRAVWEPFGLVEAFELEYACWPVSVGAWRFFVLVLLEALLI